jgi:hypothetical protein
MQPSSSKRILCASALIGLLTCVVAHANVDTNPYGAIVDRNPFGLKPPPPPPPPPEQTAPPVPMATVTLTGLLSTFGEPRALLEIIEATGKGGGGTPQRPPPMREGDRHGAVEVLAIDVVKNSVRLRNSGVETNIGFPVAKSTPAPGGPGVPGKPPTFTPPAMNIPQPNQPQASASPTVISPNGANGNSGVTVFGGNTAPATTAGLPGALGTSADGGMRTIPSRPLRTEASGGLPPMTREQADLMMEMNRLRGGPPAPPTSLTPMIEQEINGQNQNPQPPPGNFPRLPYRRGGPPPVPGR